MNVEILQRVYFLGIGGIGMSSLARYFKLKGAEVSGYDKTPSFLTRQLQSEGINIHFKDDIAQIPEKIDLIIYTPAIPKDLKEYIFLKDTGIPIKKRSEILGLLTAGKKTIAIAGTHGKTTVTSLVAHLLHTAGIGCTAFLGGIAKNYDSNLLVSGNSEWMVVEADEFDRSFLQLFPTIGVITSVDADHLDIYGDFSNVQDSYRQFAGQITEGGTLLIKKGVGLDKMKLQNCNVIEYSIRDKATYYADNIKLSNGHYVFDFITPQITIRNFKLGVPGLINVENALAALTVASITGASEAAMKAALSSFSGIKRRFDIQIKTDTIIYIDDYAHHPEEIRGFINSVRDLFPRKRILGIFQPHLYSRTRDFADEFAKSLDLLDESILLPIYPARELPVEGVNSEMILNRMSLQQKMVCSKENLIKEISQRHFDIIVTLGAGDIDQLVDPISKYLTETLKTH